MRAFAFLLASIVCAGAAAADRFSIDGAQLGMPEADVRAKFPAAKCNTPQKTDAMDRECKLERMPDSGGKSYYFIFLNGKLVTITLRFPATAYDTARPQVEKRYGKPREIEIVQVKDRAGKTLAGAIARWQSGRHALTLEQFSVISPADSTLELKDETQYDVINERISRRAGAKT